MNSTHIRAVKQFAWSRPILALLAVAGLSLTSSAIANAARVTPAIAPFHDLAYRTLRIWNRAQLLRAHPRAQMSYLWQKKQNRRWTSVPGAHRGSFTLPPYSVRDTVRVVVTFRLRRTRVALASNASVLAPAPSARTTAPAVSAGRLPSPYVPVSWSGPNPPANCAGSPGNDAADDTDSVLISMDYCGATLEGLAPLTLPANWAQLTDTQRAFVLLNLERIQRGETPFVGESTTLDGYAKQGAEANTDPSPPDGANWYGSNWFGGTDSTDAVQGYVFDDGPGSGNLACSGGAAWGCWGHRDNILMNASGTDLDVGLADGSNGDSTEVFGSGYTDLNFSWSAELAAGYPQGLPASIRLTPATISQVTPDGSGSIAVTGTDLDTVTRVWFSTVEDTSNWSCSTPDHCAIAVPKRLNANTTYSLYLQNPAGLSARTVEGTYTTGLYPPLRRSSRPDVAAHGRRVRRLGHDLCRGCR